MKWLDWRIRVRVRDHNPKSNFYFSHFTNQSINQFICHETEYTWHRCYRTDMNNQAKKRLEEEEEEEEDLFAKWITCLR